MKLTAQTKKETGPHLTPSLHWNEEGKHKSYLLCYVIKKEEKMKYLH